MELVRHALATVRQDDHAIAAIGSVARRPLGGEVRHDPRDDKRANIVDPQKSVELGAREPAHCPLANHQFSHRRREG